MTTRYRPDPLDDRVLVAEGVTSPTLDPRDFEPYRRDLFETTSIDSIYVQYEPGPWRERQRDRDRAREKVVNRRLRRVSS